MFCSNCGTRINDSEHFCVQCGSKQLDTRKPKQEVQQKIHEQKETEEKWWHRLAKVFYIVMHLPLLLIIPVVWTLNSTSYVRYGVYEDTPALATWYVFLTLIIYLTAIRLMRVAFLYVVRAEKPSWKKFLQF